MEQSSERDSQPRTEIKPKESSTESTPERADDILSRETLPHAPAEISTEPALSDRSSPPPELSPTPPSLNAMLGRLHHTAAWGIGSTIAFIGEVIGPSPFVSAVTGLGAYMIVQGLLLSEVERCYGKQIVDDDGSLRLPDDYTRGASSVLYPTVAISVLGFTHPSTYGVPAVLGLCSATTVFWALHSWGLRANDTPLPPTDD